MKTTLLNLTLLPLCGLLAAGNCFAENVQTPAANAAAPLPSPQASAKPAAGNSQAGSPAANTAQAQNPRDWFNGRVNDCKGQPADIKQHKYVAIYFSAVWCGPCRETTPKLVEFYNQLDEKQKKNLEIVFFSYDRDQQMMNNYMAMDKMPWKALKFSERAGLPYKATRNAIPNMIIVDQNGKVLLEDDPRKLMDKLRQLVAE